MGKAAAIGLDIGGGSTKLGLIDAGGNLLRQSRVLLPEGAGFVAILALYREAIAAQAGDALAGDAPDLPLGIAYPGHVDAARGIGLNSNVPALDGQPLAAALAAAVLINDADAAALAEARLHRHPRVLMVTLGTGIGVAMVVRGQTLVTAGGTLGDSGHLNLDPSGRHQCRQGCTGCLESVASGEALARDARALAQSGDSPALAAELAAGHAITAASACRAAQAGDAAAQALLTRMAEWLGMAVANWRASFQPDLILFGGGLSVLGQDFIDLIRDRANARSLPFLRTSELALARLGNDAGMIGAGLAALTPKT
ncbi:ROK family protein [Paracoccus sp. (in: a-proteobacteria)]|uniref:ROK family protein n=1 Tax=Paracoccus sp. TaxID=267 RepID=UPI0035B36EE5